MNNPELSVIIPVYNVEKYLRQCIESVIAQTYGDYEVIFIDDGSTDCSGRICDEYCRADPRLRVIHRENGGLMSAWMRGLEEAQTDRILFIDSDDWVAPQMFEILLEQEKKHDADLVICNMCLVEKGVKKRERFIIEHGYYSEERIKREVYPVMLNAGGFQLRAIPVSRWGKLIKKRLLMANLKYCDSRVSYMEDLNIIFPVLLDCRSLVVVDDEMSDYYYRANPASILHSYNKSMYWQVQLVYGRLRQAAEDKGMDGFEGQLLADYLAAIVQCYKNELMNPGRFAEITANLDGLCRDSLFMEAVGRVNWHGYWHGPGGGNVFIIYMMRHWNLLARNILTFLLYCLKRYKMNRLKDHSEEL